MLKVIAIWTFLCFSLFFISFFFSGKYKKLQFNLVFFSYDEFFFWWSPRRIDKQRQTRKILFFHTRLKTINNFMIFFFLFVCTIMKVSGEERSWVALNLTCKYAPKLYGLSIKVHKYPQFYDSLCWEMRARPGKCKRPRGLCIRGKLSWTDNACFTTKNYKIKDY